MSSETGGAAGAASAAATQAVFMSYASEDALAAERICSALRAAGVEVWFDRSELRGGDAWDAAIRRQIKSCALFLPIISANTHARAEGYFRLEWRLAEERTHLMGRARAFIEPVSVGGTPERDALVQFAPSGMSASRRVGGVIAAPVAGFAGGWPEPSSWY